MNQAHLPGVLSQAQLRAQQCAEAQNRDWREMWYWLTDQLHWDIVAERVRRNTAQADAAAPPQSASEQIDLLASLPDGVLASSNDQPKGGA